MSGHVGTTVRQRRQCLRCEQLFHRVVAEKCREQDADRWEVGHRPRGGVRYALRQQAVEHGRRQGTGEPGDDEDEDQADGQHDGGVLEGRRHTGADPSLVRRQPVHDVGTVRRGEQAGTDAVDEQNQRERQVGEVHRYDHEQHETGDDDDKATDRENTGAEPVGERPRHRRGQQEPDRQRDHVDTRPQRRLGKAVAVLRQPDPLEPDDEHELQPTASKRCQQGGDVAGGERADAEQSHVEQGFPDLRLDDREGDQDRQATNHRAEHPGVGPAHRVPAVGLDAVGDPDQQYDQPAGERRVSPPVHRGALPHPVVPEFGVGPEGPEHAERHRHQEDVVPVDGGEHTAEQEPDERAGDTGHHVDAQRQPTLLDGEGVGEDRGGVGEDERPAHTLHDPPADEPQGRRTAIHPGEGQQDGGNGENRETHVVHADASVHVPETPEGHDQDGCDDQEAQHHPQQIAGVTRLQRVDVDSAEDVRQSDQDDRGVDRGHEDAQRGVGQRNPLVLQTRCGGFVNHSGRSRRVAIVRRVRLCMIRVPHLVPLLKRRRCSASKTCLVRLNKFRPSRKTEKSDQEADVGVTAIISHHIHNRISPGVIRWSTAAGAATAGAAA